MKECFECKYENLDERLDDMELKLDDMLEKIDELILEYDLVNRKLYEDKDDEIELR